MNFTITLSEQNAAVLEAPALAAQMPPESYFRNMVAQALQHYQQSRTAHQQIKGQGPLKPKKSAYGLLAKYGPGIYHSSGRFGDSSAPRKMQAGRHLVSQSVS